MTVPTLSIAYMLISIILSIGTPVGLFLFWRKKYGLKVTPMLMGAAAFILFAMILEQILHAIVLRPDETGATALRSSPYLFMLYGGFAAGIFEETARFVSFKLLKKKHEGIGTGLSYGIGHGGIEAVLIVGVAMISNLLVSMLINMGMSDTIPLATVEALSSTASHMFLFAGIERLMAISIQISLSVIVYFSVVKKGKIWLYPVAIVLHALVDFPAVLMQAGVLSNIYIVEAMVLAEALIMAFIAYLTCKKLGHEEEQ